MRLNKVIKIILLILVASPSYWGQEDSTKTEVKQKSKVKPIFALDARNSFVLGHNTKFRGILLGVSFMERHKLGSGYFVMREPVLMKGIHVDKELYPDATPETMFRFGYLSMFYEYVWLKKKRWEVSTPLHVGVGNIDVSYIDTTGAPKNIVKGGGVIHELTVDATFKVFRWLGVNGGVGYRFILIQDDKMKNAVNAPVYSFSVKIFVGELFKMVFRRKKLEEW